MASLVSAVQKGFKDALPIALGAVGGAVATGIVTGFARKLGPLSKPGPAYDWAAPVLGAAVSGAALGALTSAVKPLRPLSTGVFVGSLAALLTHVGAKLGLRGFQTNTGTAGVGILVAEETAPLEAIVAESGNDGVALAALDDGTLAEIVAESGTSNGGGGGYEGAFAALERMVEADSGGVGDDVDDDDEGYEGAAENARVDSGGVGSTPAFFNQGWSGF